VSSKKKPVLGRNLSSMLSQTSLRQAAERSTGAGEEGQGERSLPLDRIRPGAYQPRVEFDPESLHELSESIRAQGVIQPIVVRAVGDGYEIIAGERRWRAAQQAGIDRIPVIVRDVDDETAVALALIENIQREDLNPLEEATALKRLVEDFQLTHQEAATAVGRSRSTVSNLLRLLELVAEVRELVAARKLEMGHARALLGLDERRQLPTAREVVRKQLSVRETEALVRRLLNPPKAKHRQVDPDIQRLQQQLAERLCAVVKIQHGSKGKGKLVISYNSADELEGIIGHLQGED
jgi:ParB family chromosome partitioning protein